jgi:serine/threonine-protein kinase
VLRAGERVGDWIVDGPLAEGGMGAVYRVHSPLTKRLAAALKIMKVTSEADARARFVREAEALAALRHPAVVRVMEFAEDGTRGLLYLVMELAEGDTLRARLERGPLDLDEALGIFVPLAQGLEHAHNCGVFHRDIKPSNIILCADRSVRLVDFGISASEHAEPLTNSGRLGTLAYLPPEAFKGERSKPARADVYALGLVVFEALTGQRSFPIDPNLTPAAAAAAVGVRKLQQTGAMELPERFPLLLRELVRAATSPDPKDRPRMSDIRAGLEELAGRPASLASRTAAPVGSVVVRGPDESTMRVPDPMGDAALDTVPPAPRSHRALAVAVALAALLGLGAVLLGRSQRVSFASDPKHTPPAQSARPTAPPSALPAAPTTTPTGSPETPRSHMPEPAATPPSATLPTAAPEPTTPLPEREHTPPPVTQPAKPEPAPTATPTPREPAAAVEPVEDVGSEPPGSALSGRWDLTLEERTAADLGPARRGGYRLVLRQEGDRVVGRGYKLSENGVALPESQRTALEVDGHLEGKQLVMTFVERGGGSYNSGWIRWALGPDGRVVSGRFASDAGQSGGSSSGRRVR